MLVSGAVLRNETVLVRAELKNPSEVTETVFCLPRRPVSPIHVYNLGTTTCFPHPLKNGDIQRRTSVHSAHTP